MSEKYRPKDGDRVRMVYEGTYRDGHVEVSSTCWLYENAIRFERVALS